MRAIIVACLCLVTTPGLLVAQPDTSSEKKTDPAPNVGTGAPKDLGEFPDHLVSNPPKSLKDIQLLEKRVQSVLKKVAPATVSVSGGSGVVISKDGLILTVQHVSRTPGRNVRVTFPNGKTARAVTLGGYAGVDGAMMKITDEGQWPHVEMGESKSLKDGQWCVAVGFPVSFDRGKQPPIRLGRVLRKSQTVLMTDCTIMGGDSGGPLFDLNGRVIGIHSRVNSSLSRNIHVPVDVFTTYWSRFLASESWSSRRGSRTTTNRGYLGVRRAENSDEAVVDSLIKDGAAEKGGIKVGDKIIEFDGQAIKNFTELQLAIRKKKARDRVSVKVLRDGKEHLLRVRLGADPNPRDN